MSTDDWQEPPRGAPRALLVVGAALALVAVTVLTVVLTRPGASDAGTTDGTAAVPTRTLALAVPPRLPTLGSLVDVQISHDGDVSVVTWIRSSTPLVQLRLSMPHVLGLSSTATADRVRVAGDRRFVAGSTTVESETQTYTFQRPSRVVFLSYRLLGVAHRRTSVPGLARVRATRLDLGYQPEGPTFVLLHGATVLSATCLPHGEAVATPCGARTVPGSWRVKLRGAHRRDQVQPRVEVRQG